MNPNAPAIPRRVLLVAWALLTAFLVGAALLPTKAIRDFFLLDFYDYHYASLAVVRGGDPYDARAADALAAADGVPFVPGSDYIYPLALAVVLTPLTTLPPTGAALLWSVLSATALVDAARRLVGMASDAGATPARRGALFLLAILFPPTWNTLFVGQVNNVVLWLLVVALERSDRQRLAGGLVGLAAGVKLFPAGLLAVALVARRWRTFWVGCATLVLLLALGEAASPGSTRRFFVDVLPALWEYRDHHPHPGNQSLRGVLLRMFHPNRWTVPYAELSPERLRGIHAGFSAILAGVGGVALVRTVRSAPSRELDLLRAGVVIAAAILASPLGWEATSVLLLIPIAGLLRGGHVRTARGVFGLFVLQRAFDPFMNDPAAWPRVGAHPALPNAAFLALVLCFGACVRGLAATAASARATTSTP